MKGKSEFFSKNLLLFSASAFIPKLLSFFLVPFYTGILTTFEYGIIDITTTTVSLVLPLFTLNTAEGVMRFTIDEKNNTKYLKFGVKVSILGSIILSFAFCLLGKYSTIEKLNPYWYWIPALFSVNCIYNLFQYYMRAIDQTVLMVVSSCVNSLVMLLSNVLALSVLKLGVNGYFSSLLLGYACADIVMVITCTRNKDQLKITRIEKETIKELLRYCIPTIFTALAWWVNSSLDRYFVVGLCGESENGIYSIAYKIPNILGILQAVFVQAWTLSAIVEFDKDDKDGFFGRTYDTYNGLMVLSCSIIILINIPISKILYTNDFFEAWHYVPILLVSSLFSALNGYIGSIFSAVKDTKISAYTTVISAGVNAALNTLLIPRFQIYGAAVSTLISYVMAWLIRFIASRKYIHMKIKFLRELIGYAILISQMIVSMIDSHYYFIQIGLICIMFYVLYPCFVPDMAKKIKTLFRSRK